MQPSELAPSIYAMADVNVIPLAPNIYRTALPSKTATCIACQKPIVMAIGKESIFGRKLSQVEAVKLVDSSNPVEVKEAISKLQNHEAYKDLSEFYKEHFVRSANSERYKELITRRGINR